MVSDWKKKLTKGELIHLMESGVCNKAQLKRNMTAQANMRKINPRIEPCWACKAIAEKLGMEV